MRRFFVKKLQQGQTLIEILLAFSIAILVLSAIVAGINNSLSNAQYTKNQNQASSYAQEGMAVVRQIRDSSWPDFLKKNQENYCLPQDETRLADNDGRNCSQNGEVGIFARSVILDHESPQCESESVKGTKVTVVVSWSDSKCPSGFNVLCHNVELVSCLTNIDQKQAP